MKPSGTSVSLESGLSFLRRPKTFPDLFDGGMIVLAMYSLNFFHPGPLLFAVPVEPGSMGSKSGTAESLPMTTV